MVLRQLRRETKHAAVELELAIQRTPNVGGLAEPVLLALKHYQSGGDAFLLPQLSQTYVSFGCHKLNQDTRC